MERRTLLYSIFSPLIAAGCLSEGKLLNVTTPSSAVPPRKIERVVVWLSRNDALVNAKLGDAFVAAFAPYGIAVRVGRATALELNRGEDQARLMNEVNATHRLEIEVATFRQVSGSAAEWTLTAVLYAGTSRTPLMALHYRPGGSYDYALAGVVIEKLRERGYL